jgi:hypothetical protein
MSETEAEDGRSPRAKRFTRRRVNALQRGFLPEVNKTAFAPMRGASFRTETAEQVRSDLDAAAQPTWRSPLGTPSPLIPLSPLARAIRRPIRPSMRRGGQGQGQAATEHAASLQPSQAQQPPQVQQDQPQQAQQDQPQQVAVPASVVPAEPAVPAAAAPAGPRRGGQSTFLTDEVETPSPPNPNPNPKPNPDPDRGPSPQAQYLILTLNRTLTLTLTRWRGSG